MLQLTNILGVKGVPDWHGTCVDDLLEWAALMEKEVGQTLFRGQRESWALLPRVIGGGPRGSILKNERELFTSFKKEARKCLEPPPNNDWDWLVIAQHHGLPTRLLDWSYSPKVALWFALEKYGEKGGDPEVWVMNPKVEDTINSVEKSRPFRGNRTKVFHPRIKIPRVVRQQGCFTLFKHVESSAKGFVALEKNKKLRHRLQRFRLAKYACLDALEHLETNGINRDNLYPNIDHEAEIIKLKHGYA